MKLLSFYLEPVDFGVRAVRAAESKSLPIKSEVDGTGLDLMTVKNYLVELIIS